MEQRRPISSLTKEEEAELKEIFKECLEMDGETSSAPRKLKREKVKEVLLSFRRSLRNVGSECTESSVTTFDYV